MTAKTLALVLGFGLCGGAVAVAQDAATAEVTQEAGTVHASAAEAKALKVGDALPKLAPLENSEGAEVDLSAVTKGKNTVLVFYRGGWCPYCVTHFAELAAIQPKLAEAGIELYGISPDSPEKLKELKGKKDVPYTLLSDNSHEAMKKFGIAFAVDAKTQEAYKGYGIDLTGVSGNPEAVLPVPSVFVINPEGKISFVYTNADYKKRLSGEELLKAVGVETKKEEAKTEETKKPAAH